MDEKALRETLDRTFDEDELIVLASDCGVDWDSLKGGTKVLRIVSLINYLKRRDELPRLQAASKAERANVNWDQVFGSAPFVQVAGQAQTPLQPSQSVVPPPAMPQLPVGRWSVQINDGMGGPGFMTLHGNGYYDAERLMIMGPLRAQGQWGLDFAQGVLWFRGWTNTNMAVNETWRVQNYNGVSLVLVHPLTGVPFLWTKIG